MCCKRLVIVWPLCRVGIWKGLQSGGCFRIGKQRGRKPSWLADIIYVVISDSWCSRCWRLACLLDRRAALILSSQPLRRCGASAVLGSEFVRHWEVVPRSEFLLLWTSSQHRKSATALHGAPCPATRHPPAIAPRVGSATPSVLPVRSTRLASTRSVALAACGAVRLRRCPFRSVALHAMAGDVESCHRLFRLAHAKPLRLHDCGSSFVGLFAAPTSDERWRKAVQPSRGQSARTLSCANAG